MCWDQQLSGVSAGYLATRSNIETHNPLIKWQTVILHTVQTKQRRLNMLISKLGGARWRFLSPLERDKLAVSH